jgi:hypothetical protein
MRSDGTEVAVNHQANIHSSVRKAIIFAALNIHSSVRKAIIFAALRAELVSDRVSNIIEKGR